MPACPSCGHENREGARFCDACGSSLAAVPAREQRKTVTVLFCDVTGSTELGESQDPEALRALLARYFERMKGIVEAHGGTVEKFIGDAVMAVFGVPLVHEDDALRAVRAAVEMRDALPELGVRARIGVNTGEVVTGTEERLATGDAVNVAARLEQAAQPGEVLVGEESLRLLRDAVEAEAVEPLELKGKAEPVRAYRLLAVSEAAERRLGAAPMVGRETELQRLRAAFDQAVRDRSCQLFTVLGAAGVGKSRLVDEFLAGLDATVVRGRCLPYGEGITYWPVVEVVKQLPEAELDPAAQAALANLLGEEEGTASSADIAWAVRKLLEAVAQENPLVVVFDDLHWGEETFLDLVEHVADLSRDAPLLLLCMARPDLLDRRAWAGGKLNATNVLLEPLSTGETEELISTLPGELPDDVSSRVVEAAEGNPLFVEEMVALARESGDEQVAVPPTIHALIAARLDQLDQPERGVLERGAVEGRVFHRGAVEALAPEEPQVTSRLTSLVRKELVRPDKPQLPGEDAFRFRHLLIRDAAYDGLPKSIRAELHERFALWLEEHGSDLVELDEILGYHLEQACRYRQELGLGEDEPLAAAARRRLGSAGNRAHQRGDHAAALFLLERAAALAPPSELDLAIEHDLIDTLLWRGEGSEALRRIRSLADRVSAGGNGLGELFARIKECEYRLQFDPEGATDDLAALLDVALPRFEAEGDDFFLTIAYKALGLVARERGQMGAALDALDRAAAHAQRAGRADSSLVRRAVSTRFFGPTPASELLRWIDEQEALGKRDLSLDQFRSVALALLGRFDEARSMMDDVRVRLAERGGGVLLANVLGQESVHIEWWAGNFAAAAELGEKASRLYDELGEQGFASTSIGNLARSYCELDRLDEADSAARRSEELGASDDVVTQVLWRQARAKVLARRGEDGEAEQLAREAVVIAEKTDLLNQQGDAYADLAEVLALAGRRRAATEALEQALERYELKENLAMVAQVRPRLASLLELD